MTGTATLGAEPLMAKAPFHDTHLHQRLRLGLLNAIEEKDWRASDLSRKTALSNSTLGAFLNGKSGIGVDSLDKCLRALGLTPEEFFKRCDPNWQPERLKVPLGVQPHDPEPSQSGQAAIETLKAAINVASRLLDRQTQSPAPTPPVTLRGRRRRRGRSN